MGEIVKNFNEFHSINEGKEFIIHLILILLLMTLVILPFNSPMEVEPTPARRTLPGPNIVAP